MWGCPNCQEKLNRKIIACPKCGGRASFICADCFKELPDGKHNYCGFHLQERKQQRIQTLKHVGEGAGTVVAVAVTVVSTPVKEAISHVDVEDIAKNILKK